MGGASKTVTYGYARAGGKWVEEPFSNLSWQWHHERESFGEVLDGIGVGSVNKGQ